MLFRGESLLIYAMTVILHSPKSSQLPSPQRRSQASKESPKLSLAERPSPTIPRAPCIGLDPGLRRDDDMAGHGDGRGG